MRSGAQSYSWFMLTLVVAAIICLPYVGNGLWFVVAVAGYAVLKVCNGIDRRDKQQQSGR